jgi:hypothetical protein
MKLFHPKARHAHSEINKLYRTKLLPSVGYIKKEDTCKASASSQWWMTHPNHLPPGMVNYMRKLYSCLTVAKLPYTFPEEGQRPAFHV